MFSLQKYLIMGAATVAFIVAIWVKATQTQKTKQKAKELNEYVETRKRIDASIEEAPDNVDDARAYLLHRKDK